MRRTTPGAAALTTAAVAVLLLSACTVDDDADSTASAGVETSTESAVPDPDDPATLGLAVGDCVADLGAQETEAPTSSAAATTAKTTASTSVTSAATTTPATAADGPDDGAGFTDLDGDGYPDEPVDDGTTTVADGTEDVDGTGVLDDTVPESATGIAKADCGEPHVGEVFAQQDLDNQVLFPGRKMDRLTAAVCTGEAFEDYIGAPFATSLFDVISYAPSKESWANGDRTVTCVVTDPAAGYIPGTLKDAGY